MLWVLLKCIQTVEISIHLEVMPTNWNNKQYFPQMIKNPTLIIQINPLFYLINNLWYKNWRKLTKWNKGKGKYLIALIKIMGTSLNQTKRCILMKQWINFTKYPIPNLTMLSNTESKQSTTRSIKCLMKMAMTKMQAVRVEWIVSVILIIPKILPISRAAIAINLIKCLLSLLVASKT